MIPLSVGIGIVLYLKLISYLFEHYRNATIYFILGIWSGFVTQKILVNIGSVIFEFVTVIVSEKISVKK